ncbi:MAG: DUF3095 family protein [Deltaproteobacteria bacterium]|nr:DUF3095 family protein [Deltaproteobacteria bacterium]
MSASDFYRELPPFSDFLEFASDTVYVRAPSEHHLVVSDVEGSTKAIEAGRYKTVNMIGASTIAAIMNVYGSLDLPFVFGGDGATVLVAPEKLRDVKRALRAVQRQAREVFGLNLRVGIVPIRDLEAKALALEVSKYTLGNDRHLAFFRGAGFDAAERWVKEGGYLLDPGDELPLDEAIRGLSCRWAPLKSSRGHTLAILVKGRGTLAPKILCEVAKQIDEVVDFSSPDTHPVKPSSMKIDSVERVIDVEVGLNGKSPKALAILEVAFEMAVMGVMRAFDLGVQGIRFEQYIEDTPEHSDFRKYDETLRLVIDCTDEMKQKLEALLEGEHRSGRVFYGIHRSDEALMTCFVQNMRKGGHIHFIDGAGGGYAEAARELKRQMKAAQGA